MRPNRFFLQAARQNPSKQMQNPRLVPRHLSLLRHRLLCRIQHLWRIPNFLYLVRVHPFSSRGRSHVEPDGEIRLQRMYRRQDHESSCSRMEKVQEGSQ